MFHCRVNTFWIIHDHCFSGVRQIHQGDSAYQKCDFRFVAVCLLAKEGRNL